MDCDVLYMILLDLERSIYKPIGADVLFLIYGVMSIFFFIYFLMEWSIQIRDLAGNN